MAETTLDIICALTAAYLVIGLTLGLIVLIFNPSDEKASDRVLLAFFSFHRLGSVVVV